MTTGMMKAADLSTMKEQAVRGARYFDAGREDDLLTILRRYDFDTVRLRLWNDPYSPAGEPYGAGNCDLESVLEMARQVRQDGMDLWLDLHYSDFWADPGKQYPPKAWEGLDAAGLERAVYDFTRRTLLRFREEGLDPALVQVGNEVTNGLLWPLGRVPHYDRIARFISAGIRAVREVCPKAKVMIHLDNGGNTQLYRTWFDAYLANGGADFDIIGLSYYPFWHGSLAMLEETMRMAGERYGKDMLIAETSTGFTLEDYGAYEAERAEGQDACGLGTLDVQDTCRARVLEGLDTCGAGERRNDTEAVSKHAQEDGRTGEKWRKGPAANEKLAARIDYSMTPEGQSDFIRDLMDLLTRIPGGRGKGFCWWEPAWTPVPGCGWANRAGWEYVREQGPGGNEWANQALFDFEGNALPALGVIREYGQA